MLPDPTTRPVLLSARDRRELAGLAALLKRKNFKQGSELIEAIAARWDGSDHLAVIDRRTLLELRPVREVDPETGGEVL